jgi:threonylcarbamoyladenosine tRNA methylthiotransferase MtaB
MSGSPPVVKEQRELVSTISSFAGHQRAFLKVQDGCDAFCTYCIIPQLRPVPRHKPIEVAVRETEALVRAGHKEIILTGVFLGAYGRTTALRRRWGSARSPLASLVNALARIEGVERLRLSSLEPSDVDADLLEALASNENCVPHLHLPLQSGSGPVLRRMNRQYTVEAYLRMIDEVRGALDRPAISTDIIVGFPGETDRDFQASVDVARDVGFLKIHTFPFSPREKTAAARWRRDFVPAELVRERMNILQETEADCSFRFRKQFAGNRERVIVEEAPGVDDANRKSHHVRQGRADRYFMVHFDSARARVGDLVPVRIARVTATRTIGEALVSERRCPSPCMAAAQRV